MRQRRFVAPSSMATAQLKAPYTFPTDSLSKQHFNFESAIPTPEQEIWAVKKRSSEGRPKKDVVCRFWLNGRCMNASRCVFLHVVRCLP